MKTLLHINTSIHSDAGQSSLLAARLVEAWHESNPGGKVISRDFAHDPVPHLTAERFQAFLAKPASRTIREQADVDYSDRLIAELKRADTIVIGLPMYNFGIPSTLKVYFDHVARAGETFRYTDKGSVGLLTGKKAYVVAARGGVYAGTPMDTQTAYMRTFLGFVGITDIEFVYAEGLAMGDANRQAGLGRATAAIGQLMHAPVPVAA